MNITIWVLTKASKHRRVKNTNTKQRVECRAMMYSQFKTTKKYNTSAHFSYYSQLIQFLPIFKLRVEKKEMPGGTKQLTTLIMK